MKITEYGKQRVASEDFAKCLAHVLKGVSESGLPMPMQFDLVATYTATNLIIDENRGFSLPGNDDEGAAALAQFMDENDGFIRDTIGRVLQSPAFLQHVGDLFGPRPRCKKSRRHGR
jgi:hypothetical protein